MGEGIDILNLILLAIAIGIFLKLRGVLGRRTGHERPPIDPYSAPEPDARAKRDEDNVVVLPRRGAAADRAAEAEEQKSRWQNIAPEGSPLAQALTEIALADRHFSPEEFLDGARMAYEMIVMAFAAGDRKALKPLLGESVYASFDQVIADREAKQLTVETAFIGISKAEITTASLKDRMARITVRFVSDLTTCTKNAEGQVIEGDPVSVHQVTDVWTFERDTRSRDPNWRLVATGGGN